MGLLVIQEKKLVAEIKRTGKTGNDVYFLGFSSAPEDLSLLWLTFHYFCIS